MKAFIYSFCLFSGILAGQNLKISFENSENYNSGILNNQHNWKIWGIAPENNILVSPEKASDGLRSVKILSNNQVKDDFGIETPIPFFQESEISFDINIDEIDGSDNFLVVYNSNYDIVAGFNFNAMSKIWAYDNTTFDFTETSQNFVKNNWYNAKIELDFVNHTAKYHLNNTLIHTSSIGSTISDYAVMNLWTDDFGTSFFVDNINVKNKNSMMVSNPEGKSQLQLHPNPAVESLIIDSKDIIKTVKLYDISGQLLRSETINNPSAKLNIGHLSKGVYVLKIETENASESRRFIKK